MERQEVSIAVHDAGRAPVTRRSLAALGMTILVRLAQCVNSKNAVIPSVARDLSLPLEAS